MIVLWITNVELPAIATQRGKSIFVGGWMDQTSKLLSKNKDIELHVLSAGEEYDEVEIDGIRYSGFEPNNITKTLSNFMDRICPDVIHIWGSEYLHAYQAINLLEKQDKINRVVVSIQGLVSIYVNHYFAGVPHQVVVGKTLYEIVRRRTLMHAYKDMCRQGEKEKEIFKKAKYCIGRTDWDYACAKQMNPSIQYRVCNEILRSAFYDACWSFDKCDKFTIAFSQTHYPVKGLHYMLEALAIIKVKFPKVKLRALGSCPFEKSSLKKRVKISTYQKYLKDIIDKYQLHDNIEWVGSCDEKQMVQHYLKANVFVCASTIENSSNSIGEAMMLGLPVVASDVGGIKSLLNHETEGLIYQADAFYMLADCIIRIFENSELAKNMGNNARSRALKTHSREINTETLVNIYNDIRG